MKAAAFKSERRRFKAYFEQNRFDSVRYPASLLLPDPLVPNRWVFADVVGEHQDAILRV
jgi:hypothetical protein